MSREAEAASRDVSADLPPMRLPTHGLARYVRVRLEVAGGELRWEVPRAFLGVIPVGKRRVRVPVAEIDSVRVHSPVRWLRLAVGAACVAVPLVLGLWWLAVPLGLLGVWVALVAFGPHLSVVTRAGEKHRVAICFGHRIDAELFVDAVTDMAGPDKG